MSLMPVRVTQKMLGTKVVVLKVNVRGSALQHHRERQCATTGAMDESAEECTKFRCTSTCAVMEKRVVRLVLGVVVFDIIGGSGQVHLCSAQVCRQ